MSKDYLGEFEELIMLIAVMMKDEAYGLALCREIKGQTGRNVTIGAVHATVARLEKKGFVDTYLGGSTNERGGRRKRFIRVTNLGRKVLVKSRDAKMSLWNKIPELAPGNI